MEVKIGVAETSREISIRTQMERSDVESRVRDALSGSGSDVLELEDEKGRQYLVAVSKITYVEIGEGDKRPVGFLGA